ncbi:MAG TPA: hypothetical protein VLD84_00030 [Nitrososphaeraceae archaeon]|nr:hypothetical protein [Nitrososphaeraceae archaeon]
MHSYYMIYLVFKRVPLRQLIDSIQAQVLYSIATIFSVRIQDRLTIDNKIPLDDRARECIDVGNIDKNISGTL